MMIPRVLRVKKALMSLKKENMKFLFCSDSHTVLDSYKTTVDRDIIYDESNDGKRSSDKKTAVNQLKFAEGDVEYLSRTDQFSNYETATAAPKDFSLSEEALADYRSAYTFDMANFQQGDEQMPVTGADNNLKLRICKVLTMRMKSGKNCWISLLQRRCLIWLQMRIPYNCT